jgi:hypothetical protein
MKISEAIIFIFNWFKSFIKNHPILSALMLVLFVLFWFIVGIIMLIVIAILLVKKKKKDKIKKDVIENEKHYKTDYYEKKYEFKSIVDKLYNDSELKKTMDNAISKNSKIIYDDKIDEINFNINENMNWTVNILGEHDVISKFISDEINKVMDFYSRVDDNKLLKNDHLIYIYIFVLILYFAKYDIKVKNKEGSYFLPYYDYNSEDEQTLKNAHGRYYTSNLNCF